MLLDDGALTMLPDALAAAAEGGGAIVQWAPRGGTALTEAAVPATATALRPLAPVHGRIASDGNGGADIGWVRRSRVDAGWRDQVDQPPGESREAWRAMLSPAVPGIGPWEMASPTLHIAAADMAALPANCVLAIRQVGDFALSPPLLLPLT